MRKITSFQNKLFVLENKLPSFGKSIGLPSEANWLGNFPKQSWSSSEMICWTISQLNSPENHHVKFLSQPYSFFRKFMSCTHTKFLGYPVHMKCIIPFQHNLYQHINYATFSNLQSYHMSFNINQPTPKFAHLS